jgi:hypothetical protein
MMDEECYGALGSDSEEQEQHQDHPDPDVIVLMSEDSSDGDESDDTPTFLFARPGVCSAAKTASPSPELSLRDRLRLRELNQ